MPLEQAWQDWIAFEHEFQRAQPRRGAQVPGHAVPQARAGSAVGSVSRMYYDEATGMLYGAFRYPGVVEHVGALEHARRQRPATGRHQGRDALPRHVVRLRSGTAAPRSTPTTTTRCRDLMAVDVQTGEERMLLENARIGEIVFNPADRSLMGVRHANGLATLVRIPYPYDRWYQQSTRFPYGVVPYDLDISPDGALLSASMTEVNGDQFLRVWELAEAPERRRRGRSREFRFGQSVPESFVFSPRRALPLRQQLLHRRLQHLPLRGRHRRGRGGVECRDRLLPAVAARRRAARRAGLHRRRLRPGDHRSAGRSTTSARSRSSAPKLAEKYPGGQDVAGAAARAPSTMRSWSPDKGRTCRWQQCRARQRVSRAPGLQELRSASATTSISRTRSQFA